MTANIRTLREFVEKALEDYFDRLDGFQPVELYNLVIKEVEGPLIQSALKHANYNQTLAAEMLGISRGTLRKKLREAK